MRARKYSVNQMSKLAIQHLDRNTSLLAKHFAERLQGAPPIQKANPYLIALDAIDLNRITDFKWSPWYSGTDIHRAIASDPIVDGGVCQDLLAHSVRDHLVRGLSSDVVFPDAMALKGDECLNKVALELAYCGNRVSYVLRYNDDESTWLSLFDDTIRAASNAGAFEVGFCITARPTDNADWTQEQLDAMIDDATLVFETALDGDGYVIWEA
jgi:hypothetical protein